MTKGEFNALLAGVGGQGLMLLSTVIGNACALSNLKVITGEQHGLSQRSGSISVHLRIGPEVISPLIPVGSADMMVSLEALETLRYIEYLEEGGIVITNSRIMHPISETFDLSKEKIKSYFDLPTIESRIQEVTDNILSIDSLSIAKEAGNPLTENTVMLGTMTAFSVFPVPYKTVQQALIETVPKKAIDANLKALEMGFRLSHDKFCDDFECRDMES